MAIAGVGGRTFILAITSEDLSINYNVESQILSQFPSSGGTKARDRIQLTISAVDLVASSSSVYTIDGNGLHNLAVLSISLEANTRILAKGGTGGKGGSFLNDGNAGDVGGSAFSYGV